MLVKSQFLQRNLLCPLKLGDGSASTWARNGTGPPTWCSYWRYVAIFWVPCNLTGNVLRTPHHDADGAQEWECYKTGGFSRIVYFQTKELCPPTTNNHRLGLMIFRYHKFGASTWQRPPFKCVLWPYRLLYVASWSHLPRKTSSYLASHTAPEKTLL